MINTTGSEEVTPTEAARISVSDVRIPQQPLRVRSVLCDFLATRKRIWKKKCVRQDTRVLLFGTTSKTSFALRIPVFWNVAANIFHFEDSRVLECGGTPSG
jgi:hypothetical protein